MTLQQLRRANPLPSFPPPRKFTNALLRAKDITALIRDTETHERALFTLAPSHPESETDYAARQRRTTGFGPTIANDRHSKNIRAGRHSRQIPVTAALLGGEVGERLRYENAQTGKEHGDVDVDLLLNGAARLCDIYPIAGAREKITSLRSRFTQLTTSIAGYESRVSKQTSQLARMNRRGDTDEGVDGDVGQEPTDVAAEVGKSVEVPITAEDIQKEEHEIRELEKKKRTLEERVSGMERDLGGLLR
ncbi:MAG: hypothetical protein Q9174_000559 [Haloplaca sp. 1 TL-2023]